MVNGQVTEGGFDTLLVEEESVPGLGGIDELDDGLSYFGTGTIVDNAAWGADGFGAATAVNVGGQVYEIASGGSATVFFDADGQLQAGGEGAAAVLTVNSDGTYRFEMLGAMNHPSTQGENDLLLQPIAITGVDGDGDPVDVGLKVSVQDDVPTVEVEVERFTSVTGTPGLPRCPARAR